MHRQIALLLLPVKFDDTHIIVKEQEVALSLCDAGYLPKQEVCVSREKAQS